ncbi:menaquinone biosynthetic enzyme MqnA/MqnD family protein [Thalassoglobus polymorphus]|uniref:Chorismate dehydratase n=1 Tax=Thalassoglobus polymorphus TaxID=2527994 RepID=A0A517QMU0_9PLAN|nr:menaquinone biosynthesis protein [Thalassoglobus polymorphus]QDT32877.1 Chorismate dehydratase [Thalassoglobus polymorphus]
MIDRARKETPNSLPEKKVRATMRIGAVSYLNSKPLVEDLESLCTESDCIFDVPSRLADGLASGDLDVALIPSVESFLNPEYEVVSDACIATHGPVMSVKLYSRVHPGEIRTLALDEGSRTSAALTRIMLEERFGVSPELQKLPLKKTTRDTNADAVLLIGDRAISPPKESFHTVWDLGEEWVNWTGLPFVFAMWVTRQNAELGEIPSKLAQSRNAGLNAIERIAQDGADALNLDYETSLNYLTKNLYFKLGDAERAGLKMFQELAANLGLADSTPLSFRESTEPEEAELISA